MKAAEIRDWLVAILTVALVAPGLNGLIRGSWGILTLSALLLLWSGLLYIRFKTVMAGNIAVGVGVRPVKKPAYPEWLRKIALIGLIATPLFGFASFVSWKMYQRRPSGKIVILVANFDGPHPTEYRVTETIIEQLQETTKQYGDVGIVALGEPISIQQGSKAARSRGGEHKANIVLWGWYGRTAEHALVTVHLEVLRGGSLLIKGEDKRLLIAPSALLNAFELQFYLSEELGNLIHLVVGLARFEAQDFEGAIAALTKALPRTEPMLFPHPLGAYLYRAHAYSFSGHHERAIADYSQAIKFAPVVIDAYNGRGNVYVDKGNYDLAIADFSEAIRIEPSVAELYNNRGLAFAGKGEFDRAIADYNDAIRMKPKLYETYFNRGNALRAKGELDRAISDYTYALSLAKDPDCYVNRGYVYQRQGAYQAALADFARALKLNPDIAAVYGMRGIIHEERGDLDKAIADYERAIQLKPDFAEVYTNRGNVHRRKGNLTEAIRDYTRAIETKPDLAEAYYARGQTYQTVGKMAEAVTDYARAVELKPSMAEAYVNRGNIRADFGDLESAISDYNEAIKQHPEMAEAYYNRALAYLRAGDKAKAISDLLVVLTLTSDTPMRESTRRLLEQLGPE